MFHPFINSFVSSFFFFFYSSILLFVYSFIIYNYSLVMMYISSLYSSPPSEKKSQQTKTPMKKKIQGSDTVLFTWNPVPCTVPVRWWIPPTGQGDTVITQGSVTVPLGGKRARSVMYLTVNTKRGRDSAIHHCKQSSVLVCQHNTYIYNIYYLLGILFTWLHILTEVLHETEGFTKWGSL